MLFKSGEDTVVWDREADRELCRFVSGELETDDLRTCRILIELGYEHEGELPEVQPEPDAPVAPVVDPNVPPADPEPTKPDKAPKAK